MKINCVCAYCGKEFSVPKAWYKKGVGKFCSRECSDKGRIKKSINFVEVSCVICGSLFKVKHYRKNSAKTCSKECLAILKSKIMTGERHPNWKGGTSSRDSKYKKWALKVISRDLKCSECGSIENLHAHHIKSWKDFPELRYDLDNGITLCDKHHARKHEELSTSFIIGESKRKIKVCKFCNNEFIAKREDQIFCSNKCKGRIRYTQIEKICIVCGAAYKAPKYRAEHSKACSLKCAGAIGRMNRGVKNEKTD